jgi:hypothetical protein
MQSAGYYGGIPSPIIFSPRLYTSTTLLQIPLFYCRRTSSAIVNHPCSPTQPPSNLADHAHPRPHPSTPPPPSGPPPSRRLNSQLKASRVVYLTLLTSHSTVPNHHPLARLVEALGTWSAHCGSEPPTQSARFGLVPLKTIYRYDDRNGSREGATWIEPETKI